jgi:ubiquinone biosynthesis protein
MIKLSSIPQFARHAKRFREILGVLLKYGLANWITETDPGILKELFKDPQGVNISGQSLETRIRLAFSELGTTFIKLGQILSTRADIIGPGLARELEALQSHAPSDPPQKVRELIQAELGKPVEELFTEFEDKPIASASIGQVHTARTAAGEVVVKVQHSGVQKAIQTDLEILAALAELAEKYNSELRLYKPTALVAEFKRTILKELDFRREARHLTQFRANFSDDDQVVFPKAYPELCTHRVLTMQRLRGISVAQAEILTAQGLDTKDLAKRGAAIFLDMIFHHGFYHADPHPGNIWVLEGGAIAILDCGQVGRLDEFTREKLEDLLLSANSRDLEYLTEILCRLGGSPQDLDRRALQADLDDFLAEYSIQQVSELDVASLLNDLTAIIRHHRIMLPANVSMLVKVLLMLEGTSNRLNREFNLVELLQPYSADALQRRMSPLRMLKKLQRSYRDWEHLLQSLPNDLNNIIQLIRAGKFDVHLEHRRLDPVINRLIYGILTAAMFLGSCLLLAGELPPLVKGISLPGAAGCAIASALGWRLIRAIHKSGDLK